MKIATLSILGSAVLAMPAMADDHAWPQWRGPSADGVVPGENPVLEWSEDKNVRWKVEVPGSGTSTPIIVGDKIFLLSAEGTGQKVEGAEAEEEEEAGQERDAERRRPRGREGRPRPRPDGAPQARPQEDEDEDAGRGRGGRRRGFGNFDGDGPLPEFAKPYDKDDDGKLSEEEREAMRSALRSRRGRGGRGGGFGGRGGGRAPDEVHRFSVICLDRKTGETVWSKAVREEVPHEGHHGDHGYASASPVTDGEHLYADFGSRGLYCLDLEGNVKWEKDFGDMRTSNGFGEGTSPALAGDSLIVKWDHEGDSFIVVLDKSTGEERWRKPRDERTSWSTPFIVTHDGVTQVIASATGKIISYDLKTGDILWESTGMTGNVIPTPVAADGVVYVTSGFRTAALQAIDLSARGVVDKDNGLLWTHDEGTPYVPSPLLYQGRLYFFQRNDNRLTSLDAKTGEPHYSRQTVEGLRGVYASPIAVGDHIYLVGRRGNVVVIKSSDDLEIVATNTLDDEFDAAPVVVDDALFLRGKKNLYCIAKGKDA